MRLRSLVPLLALCAIASAEPNVALTHIRGGVYLAIDTFYVTENSVVYIGPEHVTVVGATWRPATAP